MIDHTRPVPLVAPASRPLSDAQRRRRNQMLDGVRTLVSLGPRGAGSLAEAQAAAIINGKLRNVGLQVIVEPFRSRGSQLLLRPWLSLLAALTSLVYGLLPLAALLGLLALVLLDLLRARGPGFGQRQSQNVVATRATQGQPRWRLVLLAPLDAPPQLAPVTQVFGGPGIGAALRRSLAVLALLLLMLVGLFSAQPLWWYAQALPASYLVASALADRAYGRAEATPGALSFAASLALLIAAAEQLGDLRYTELWVLALGTSASPAGLDDFFGRYPFERQRTLVIGLEGIGAGQPTSITRQGIFGHLAADPLLLRLAAAADAADPEINVEPRPYRAAPTYFTHVLRQGWRGMSIATLDPHGRVPFRSQRDDQPEQIDEQVLDRTLRLVVGVARQLDHVDKEPGHG